MIDNVEQQVVALSVSLADFVDLLTDTVEVFCREIALSENIAIVSYRGDWAAGGDDLINEIWDLVFTHFVLLVAERQIT